MLKNKTIQRKLAKKAKQHYATFGGVYYVLTLSLMGKEGA